MQGERRLEGTPDLRFGGVKMRFIPAGAASPDVEPKGTRAIAAVDRQRPSSSAAPAPAAPATPEAGSGLPAWVWIIGAVVVAAAAFFLIRGPA